MATFEVTLGYWKNTGAELLIKNQEIVEICRFAEKVEEGERRKYEVALKWAIGDNPLSYGGLINRIKTLYGQSVVLDHPDDYLRLVEKHGNVRNDLDPGVRIHVKEIVG